MNLYENIKSNLNESKHGSDYLNGDMVNYFCNEYYKHEDEPHKWTKKEMKDWIIDDQKYCKSNNTDSLFTLEHLDNLLDLQHDLYKSDLEESDKEQPIEPSYEDESEVTGRIHVTYMFNSTFPKSWNHDDIENEIKSNLSEYTDEIEDIDFDFSYEGPQDHEDNLADEYYDEQRLAEE